MHRAKRPEFSLPSKFYERHTILTAYLCTKKNKVYMDKPTKPLLRLSDVMPLEEGQQKGHCQPAPGA